MNFNGFVIPTLILALCLYVVGLKLIQRCHTPVCAYSVSILSFVIGIPGFLFPLYYLHWFDGAEWFYEFRSLFGIELSAAGVGLFAGLLGGYRQNSRSLYRVLLVMLLCLGMVIPYIKPVLSPIDKCRFQNRWEQGVCLQSTPTSCGAASAATIFHLLGFNLQESDVARECYTSGTGTENWYIARAFRRRECSVNYRVETGLPSDLNTPAIAGVRIGQYGHFIAILDKKDGRYITGDPLSGRQEIMSERIEREFDFTGFFMEVKKGK